jgi:hypothetical protein
MTEQHKNEKTEIVKTEEWNRKGEGKGHSEIKKIKHKKQNKSHRQ